MQGKRQAFIHRQLISTKVVEQNNQRNYAISLGKQPPREEFKNPRVSKMGRPKKHSLSVHSEKLTDPANKYEQTPEDEKRRFNIKTRNLLSFFPTYTQLLDNHVQKFFSKTIIVNQEFEGTPAFQSLPNPEQRAGYERKKLAPIRKPRRDRNGMGKNSNVSFLNVEKLSLQPLSENSDKDKMAMTTSFMGRKRASASLYNQRQSSKEMIVHMEPIVELIKKPASGREEMSVTRFKPFALPFERYHYFDFLWKVAFSNAIKTEFQQTIPKKYKIYIGPGNNSMLIKTIFKRREGWWALTNSIEEANFVWTQIKVNSIHSHQEKYEPADWITVCDEHEKKSPAYRRNKRILNLVDAQKWMDYFHKNRQIEEKLGQNFSRRTKALRKSNQVAFNCEKLRSHNHLPRNYVLGNKKALFSTMKKYYECMNKDVFESLPLTFHIEQGTEDPEYFKFLKYYYNKAKGVKGSEEDTKGKSRNIWIVKPGQFTNRGNGIVVCKTLDQVKNIIKNRKKLDSGGMRTYIVQEYLDRPFLYQKRKFDIRHFMLITCINGHVKGYWYMDGYIRTTSYEYSVKNSLSSVHLTNDAVQKNLPDYGKYEKGNKVSYDQFERYLEANYGGKYSFYKSVYPRMKSIAFDSMRASAELLNEGRKGNNFEIFGFDFMIDSHFRPWLIEINTNPCLELSSPVLMDVLPNLIENVVKVGVDSVFPPPYSFTEKRPRFSSNILEENKLELLYDSTVEEEELQKIWASGEVKLNFKELQKDQEEEFEDDGIELED